MQVPSTIQSLPKSENYEKKTTEIQILIDKYKQSSSTHSHNVKLKFLEKTYAELKDNIHYSYYSSKLNDKVFCQAVWLYREYTLLQEPRLHKVLYYSILESQCQHIDLLKGKCSLLSHTTLEKWASQQSWHSLEYLADYLKQSHELNNPESLNLKDIFYRWGLEKTLAVITNLYELGQCYKSEIKVPDKISVEDNAILRGIYNSCTVALKKIIYMQREDEHCIKLLHSFYLNAWYLPMSACTSTERYKTIRTLTLHPNIDKVSLEERMKYAQILGALKDKPKTEPLEKLLGHIHTELCTILTTPKSDLLGNAKATARFAAFYLKYVSLEEKKIWNPTNFYIEHSYAIATKDKLESQQVKFEHAYVARVMAQLKLVQGELPSAANYIQEAIQDLAKVPNVPHEQSYGFFELQQNIRLEFEKPFEAITKLASHDQDLLDTISTLKTEILKKHYFISEEKPTVKKKRE